MLYRETPETSAITAPSLLIEDGKTVRLSSLKDLTTAFIRPRHIYSLKTLAGIPTRRPARLSDTGAFERMDRLGECVDLQATDNENRIAGYSVSLLRNIVTALDPEQSMPDRIKWEIPLTNPCGCRGSQNVRKVADSIIYSETSDSLHEVKYRSRSEIPVPSFLKNFTVAVKTLALADIVVGYRSTLVIDGNTGALLARNFLAYEGSRIVQADSDLIIDIFGTLRGGISRFLQFVKKDSTTMKIDWEILAKQPTESL